MSLPSLRYPVAFVAAVFALMMLGAGTTGVRAQVSPGIHVARASQAFGGAYGLGASLDMGAPLFPVRLMVAGDYFRPDCGASSGCSFMGASADLHFALSAPVIHPYGLVGAVVRRRRDGVGQDARSSSGLALGAGLDLRAVAMGAYGEARYEFAGKDELVFRLGIRF
ncbi:MAG: hypothetical protein LJF04_01945 [Gemmatimonadetes bacterium]|nr:hypothetical protein [Gemmatimonadota bacterium]